MDTVDFTNRELRRGDRGALLDAVASAESLDTTLHRVIGDDKVKRKRTHIQELDTKIANLNNKTEELLDQLKRLTEYVQLTEVKRAATYRLLENKAFTPEEFQKTTNDIIGEMRDLIERTRELQEQGKPVEDKDNIHDEQR